MEKELWGHPTRGHSFDKSKRANPRSAKIREGPPGSGGNVNARDVSRGRGDSSHFQQERTRIRCGGQLQQQEVSWRKEKRIKAKRGRGMGL